MKILEERILKDGQVLPGNVLKVGSFLNHQIDSSLLYQIGREIKELYKDSGITKIVTIEASGIAFAAAAGMALGVPVVFAKKHHTSNVTGSFYSAKAYSYTHQAEYTMIIPTDYISETDNILIVDDFLAKGGAVNGLLSLIEQAGARVGGITCAIEKGFQGGGDTLRQAGYRVESLAVIESMTDSSITFRK